jgi:hypothetical protein
MIVKETIRITPSGESAAYDRILAGTEASFHWRSPFGVRRRAFRFASSRIKPTGMVGLTWMQTLIDIANKEVRHGFDRLRRPNGQRRTVNGERRRPLIRH